MPLKDAALAVEIKDSLGFGALETSGKNSDFAGGIVKHIKTGIVAFAPGTITGNAPSSGGPLSNGAGKGGKIALIPAGLEGLLAAAFGAVTPEIKGMANAITTHIVTAGSVTFKSGSITGTCSNSSSSPGVLAGAGANGIIEGLNGAALAALMASGIKQGAPSPQLLKMCDAICKHIMTNAKVTLPVVTGVCAAGGGPITGGTAAGGTIA